MQFTRGKNSEDSGARILCLHFAVVGKAYKAAMCDIAIIAAWTIYIAGGALYQIQ